MLNDQFNTTIDLWISELEKYGMEELLDKPAEKSWSAGQVYMHLLNETEYYIEQIKECVGNNNNAQELMKEAGMKMFLANEFPDEIIKGDPGATGEIMQPENKRDLMMQMQELKLKMNELWSNVQIDDHYGKTRHPGLGYFTAKEWFQFAEMHLRHHLRQKQRIDDYLHTRKSL